MRTRRLGTKNTKFMTHIDHRWTLGSLIPLFRPRPVVGKTGSVLGNHLMNPSHHWLNKEPRDPFMPFDYITSQLDTFHMYRHMSQLLSIPSTASAFGINPPFQVIEQVPSPMASSSNADVLDEATTTLIVGIKNMKESKTPQQVENYIHKLQSLGRHMQLQQFRNWLNDQCGLPIEVRPSNINTQEYLNKDQIEQWINDWTKKNAKGSEQRVLKNFLLMDFAVRVQPNPKMQPCSNCDQQFMLFMLLPMKQHNMNTYDPDEHRLFCYNCCTEVGQMLHPGRYVPPDQQATERQKALNQNPPGMTMAECELRALSGDRGYIPPTWYLATPPNSAIPPDHAIILHRWDTVDQVTIHEGRRRHRCLTVLSTRMATVDPPGVADQASTLPTGTPDTSLHHIQEPPRRYHRDTTEPLQEEGRLGPLGPPGIPCHTSRHRSLDPGATTTPTVGESLRRVGENQLHPHGNRPQQWPIGLHQSQRQHSAPARLPGGGAPESPSTLHLSEHRVQLCHQSITLDQLGHTDKTGQIPLSQMPHRVSTLGRKRC